MPSDFIINKRYLNTVQITNNLATFKKTIGVSHRSESHCLFYTSEVQHSLHAF